MANYCNGSKKATIKITGDRGSETIISKQPPVSIAINPSSTNKYENYTHSMTAPMNKTFKNEISSVVLNDSRNDWIYALKDSIAPNNPPNDLHTQCPLVGKSVVPHAEGLIIEGKKLRSNFDVDTTGRDAYFNNSGSCSYRVYFGGFQLIITDTGGKIYDRLFEKEPFFTVACDDDCPPGTCKCPSSGYPGFCCIDCSQVGRRITNLASRL